MQACNISQHPLKLTFARRLKVAIFVAFLFIWSSLDNFNSSCDIEFI